MTSPAPDVGRSAAFTVAERRRLLGFYSGVAALHAIGCGLYVYGASGPSGLGLGLAAYLFGLRHAFDADHIAAIDDTVRLLLHDGRRSFGAGFFFALGHAAIAVLLAIAVAYSAPAVRHALPSLNALGGVVGAGVSGLFLWTIGLLNLRVLLDVLAQRPRRRDPHATAPVATPVRRRRRGGAPAWIRHSWQMVPVGLLFGLGFDTGSELALLAMTSAASTSGVPIATVLSLPFLFAAGMSLADTTDGIVMARAYDWALLDPRRRYAYNVATTGLSVGVALLVGTIELLQCAAHLFGGDDGVSEAIRAFDFGLTGAGVVAVFVTGWIVAAVWWTAKRRGDSAPAPVGDAPRRSDAAEATGAVADVRSTA